MPRDHESVAQLLMDFVDTTRWQAADTWFQDPSGSLVISAKPKRHYYERCIAELDESERAALAHLIAKMQRTFQRT